VEFREDDNEREQDRKKKEKESSIDFKLDDVRDIANIWSQRLKQRIEAGEGETFGEQLKNSVDAYKEAYERDGMKATAKHAADEFKKEMNNIGEDAKEFADRYTDRIGALKDTKDIVKERNKQRIEAGEGETFGEQLKNSVDAYKEAYERDGMKGTAKHAADEFKKEIDNLKEDGKKLFDRLLRPKKEGDS
jgi:flagellar hook-basal body complex protein FliE